MTTATGLQETTTAFFALRNLHAQTAYVLDTWVQALAFSFSRHSHEITFRKSYGDAKCEHVIYYGLSTIVQTVCGGVDTEKEGEVGETVEDSILRNTSAHERSRHFEQILNWAGTSSSQGIKPKL